MVPRVGNDPTKEYYKTSFVLQLVSGLGDHGSARISVLSSEKDTSVYLDYMTLIFFFSFPHRGRPEHSFSDCFIGPNAIAVSLLPISGSRKEDVSSPIESKDFNFLEDAERITIVLEVSSHCL